MLSVVFVEDGVLLEKKGMEMTDRKSGVSGGVSGKILSVFRKCSKTRMTEIEEEVTRPKLPSC